MERLDKLEQQKVIGAFDKRTIIELSGDVFTEITQKYENVQKGVGDMMRGALIETEARAILNQGEEKANRKFIERMLAENESVERITLYTGCSMQEVLKIKEQREKEMQGDGSRNNARPKRPHRR